MKIVFFHGFLGMPSDWDPLIRCLDSSYQCYPLPLPENLDDFPLQLKKHAIDKCHLVGYSMGGRVALQLQKKYPELITSLILLSAHCGLKDEEAKKKRWEEDCAWAEKLLHLPLESFLELWYSQALFEGFLIPKIRFSIDPLYHSRLLTTYSLSKQDYLLPPINALALYGEKDLKYVELYRTLKNSRLIKECGHVIHLENPRGAADAMDPFWRLSRYQLS